MSRASDYPGWHAGPTDSFHGRVTDGGPFKPTNGRYHLYIGLFCPFAHRANIVVHLKQLEQYAGIETSIVRPYPKGDENGWPGWQFNVEEEPDYDGATKDRLFGFKYMHEVYFKADKGYKGRYSVPVLWDKELNTIVNNESHELLRNLQTDFNALLPNHLASITLYPEQDRALIDRWEEQIQSHLNTRVYKAGFAPGQEQYDTNVIPVFAMLNQLEKAASQHGGPYIFGKNLTEIDVRVFASLIRFDTVYVQHFKCNLGTIRHNYPVLNNWLKYLYWEHPEFRETTDFRHIKENYTKSHYAVNPTLITPLGPWPHIESGYVADLYSLTLGGIDMPLVVDEEKRQHQERK